MNDLKTALDLDFKYLFLAFVLILVAIKFLWTLLEWVFVEKLGIETKKQRELRTNQKQLEETAKLAKQTAENLSKLEAQHIKDEKEFRENLNKHMAESEKDRKTLHAEMKQYSENRIKDREQSMCIQRELTSSMDKLTSLFVDKQISDYRWEIINLADKISQGKSASKECFKHAIATHTKYEKIIEENGLTNGEVEISMEIINDAYRNLMMDGQ